MVFSLLVDDKSGKRLCSGSGLMPWPLAVTSIDDVDIVTRRVKVASSLLALSASEALRRRTEAIRSSPWLHLTVSVVSRSFYDASHLSLYGGFSS